MNKVREELFKRFIMSEYKDSEMRVMLFGCINPQIPNFDKISYVVIKESFVENGPLKVVALKVVETPFIKLKDAIKLYNSYTPA